MSSSWPGRAFRRSRAARPPHPVSVALTEAFFDLDKRQSIAESAVEACEQLFPEQRMRERWEPVVSLCYAATSAYLTESGEANIDQRAGVTSQSEATRRQITAAAQAVDGFYGAHRAQLEHAQALLAAVPAEAERAAAAANSARQQLGSAAAKFVDYPSVRSASDALRDATAALDVALATGNAKSIRASAVHVRTAAAELEDALTQAPAQDGLARQGLASVTTRLAAVSTRAERLPPAFSSLLREFNAASSEDLTHNERTSRRIMEQAAADLAEARETLSQGNPERARELTNSARSHLAEAEELVDAVTDRLTLLRTVRENPAAREDQVRFKLRDAQMLAVSRGLVQEWASVLDAQVERIDRAVAQLSGRNPDYWAYISGLDAVSTFISGVVQRMRTQLPEMREPGAS